MCWKIIKPHSFKGFQLCFAVCQYVSKRLVILGQESLNVINWRPTITTSKMSADNVVVFRLLKTNSEVHVLHKRGSPACLLHPSCRIILQTVLHLLIRWCFTWMVYEHDGLACLFDKLAHSADKA